VSLARIAHPDSGGPIYANSVYDNSDAPGDVSIVANTTATAVGADVVDEDCGGNDVYDGTIGSAAYKMSDLDIEFDV
jgi:hypothetical protein